MQLFYCPNITERYTNFNFSKEERRHIVKVLRKKPGDFLHITNGKGWLFKATLTSASTNECLASINYAALQPKRNYNLHLIVAPTKMNDRYEWFLEKATEIGIEEITPIICDNSERKIIKLERFQRIIQSAMKQSLQCYLPKLNQPVSFKDYINKDVSGQKFIAHCKDNPKDTLKLRLKLNEDCTILIGPEGDFSNKEIKMALQHQYTPITLGKTRLRTETAALAACHSIALLNS